MRRVSQQDVFRLEVAVYDFMFFEEQQGVEELFRESPDESEGETAEGVELDEFVEVHGEQLRGDAEMGAEVEGGGEVDEGVFAFRVLDFALVRFQTILFNRSRGELRG